jgi:formylmethanofuran dehydrogenase subunit A
VTPEDLERQIDRVLDSLRQHAGDGIDAARVRAVGLAHYKSLHRHATINDFIPLLVYRHAKEELSQIRRDQLHRAA